MFLRVMAYLIVLALAVLILSPYKAQAATILTVVGCNPVADGQGRYRSELHDQAL